jgi:hypothetical protein
MKEQAREQDGVVDGMEQLTSPSLQRYCGLKYSCYRSLQRKSWISARKEIDNPDLSRGKGCIPVLKIHQYVYSGSLACKQEHLV